MTMIRHAVSFAMLSSMSLSVAAASFKIGDDIEGTIHGAATFGTMIRTESPDPGVYGATYSTRVPGATPGQLNGNAGLGDLNFKKGRPVSTVLKGHVDLELKRQNLGLFVRAKAWNDFELKDGNRAYGNMPNGYVQNVPLSDNGFDPAAKFSNAQFADVYAFGKFDVGSGSFVDVRVGRQTVKWGVAKFIGGGMNAINAVDIAARVRPGALPQEGIVPVGMIYANLAAGKQWGVDGFVQYEYRPLVLPPCGTFFNASNFVPTGCSYASVLGTVTDPVALAAGLYPHRMADENAKDSGQYGLSLRYASEDLNTEFRGYAANYHDRAPSIRTRNPDIAGGYGTLAAPAYTRLTDPNGLKYGIIYAEDIRLYGLSFDTKVDQTTRGYGEIAYRPNQALNMNASDLIAAFLTRSPTSLLNLARNTNSIPPGGTFDAFDRFKVTTVSLGLNKVLPGAWGAEQLTLNGEVGWSHVAGLPDPGVMRYGRSDNYGAGAINGVACTDTSIAQKSCSHDGYITSNAWGYRILLSGKYPGALLGATLTPSFAFSHDVRGYSYDGTFLEGRQVYRAALRTEWAKKYFVDVQYTGMAGGKYNRFVDRDNLVVAGGIKF